MSGSAGVKLGCALLLSALGCAGATSQRAGVASPSAAVGSLSGVWSEYWSVAGEADTQRYTFSDNGEFRWAAAPSVSAPQAGTPLVKRGKFELHQSEQRRWLVLQVATTELAGCDSACDDDARAHEIEHQPALLEELEVSDCPPNVEAQKLDAGYACLALGDHAFWRVSAKAEQTVAASN